MDKPIGVTDPDGTEGRASQLLLTLEQAATALAICRTKLYELLRTEQLESVHIGSSRRIPAAALGEYVERLRNKVRPIDQHTRPLSPDVRIESTQPATRLRVRDDRRCAAPEE